MSITDETTVSEYADMLIESLSLPINEAGDRPYPTLYSALYKIACDIKDSIGMSEESITNLLEKIFEEFKNKKRILNESK